MEINKNIILFVGTAPLEDIQAFSKKINGRYRLALAYSDNPSKEALKNRAEAFDILIKVPFKTEATIYKALQPYLDEFLAVTCRSEAKIIEFTKVIPLLPYLRTPTIQSLLWSVNKLSMRRKFRSYNRKITPRYRTVEDASKKTIAEITAKIRFPMVIKPTGLAQSLLVSLCYHEEELEKNLKTAFRKIKALHKNYKDKDEKATIIVEEFMEGDMYSIDGYVNSRGKTYFCPMVAITTGKNIGFDDFFGYKQITPTSLRNPSVIAAQKVAVQAVHAIGLRSTSVHVELMKTEDGFKVIEIGPRVGGFRNAMYKLSYDIDHTANDVFIRIPIKPIIPKKILGHTAAMKFFAKKEGTIKSITGIKKARELQSFYEINVHAKVGDRAIFAKNGGKSIFNIILHNKDRSKLLADIRRLESFVKIKTK